jgi:hypothetical protein
MLPPYQLQRDLIRVREAELARVGRRPTLASTPRRPLRPGWLGRLVRVGRLVRRRWVAASRPSTVDG